MSDQLPRAAGAVAAALAVGLLAAGQSPAGAGTPEGATAPRRAAAPTAKTHTVTLVTGDVVTLTRSGDGPGTAHVEPAPGGTGGVQIQAIGNDLHVVPDEALPFLASGRLDQDLFNVTGLVEQGYDDASVDAIPLHRRVRRGHPVAARRPAVHRRLGAAGEHQRRSRGCREEERREVLGDGHARAGPARDHRAVHRRHRPDLTRLEGPGVAERHGEAGRRARRLGRRPRRRRHDGRRPRHRRRRWPTRISPAR